MIAGALFFFLIGLCIGSFLNVVVFRTHAEMSLGGRSHCMVCEAPIAWYDLIPVVSFLMLGGKCRSCHQAISWQYPVVEFVTGLVFMLAYTRYATQMFLPPTATVDTYWIFLVRDLLFSVFLIIVFVYDLRYVLILDRFTVPAMIIALGLNVWLGMDPLSLLLGGLVIGSFFLSQYLLSRGTWVGGGDIRMGILMGLMLGLRDGLLALFIAYMIGAIVGIGLLLSGKATPRSQVAFGTFLTVATFVALLFGDPIVNWYLGMFTT